MLSAARRMLAIAGVALAALSLSGAAGAAIKFSAPNEFPAGPDPNAVVAADFNGDGRPDLAVADFNSVDLSVLAGTGGGGFGAPQTLVGAAGNPESIAVGRFNPGKDLEIASGMAGKVSVFFGGAGTSFGAVVPIGNYGVAQARGTVIGDFNRDHNADMAVSQDGGSILLFLGNGDGTFQQQQAFNLPPGFPGPLASGRVNRDKRPDIVAGGEGSRSLSVFRARKGDDVFRPPKRYRGPSDVNGLQLGDLNGDRRTDIVAVGGGLEKGSGSKPTLAVLLGHRKGFKPTKQTVLPGKSEADGVAIADFDRDGAPDLAVARNNGKVDVFPGKGDGTFAKPEVIGTGFDLRAVIAAKLNADKHPDLVLADGGGNAVAVMLGKP